MRVMEEPAESINTLASFCGIRDLDDLDQKDLNQKYGFAQADALVMYGACIPAVYENFVHAYKSCIARKYCLSGGIGHTTKTLQRLMEPVLLHHA